MKKFLIIIFSVLVCPAALIAGFNFGLVKAAKKKVDQIDNKVVEKKEEIRLANINHAPSLSWTGETGYASDGLNLETGSLSTSFVFRVKYTDADNNAPAVGYPKIHIKKNGTEVSGSPFLMTFVSGANNSGAIYTYSKVFSSTGTDYGYSFEAQDLIGAAATGAPLIEKDAPDISNAPVLSWTGESNYASAGVAPQLGDKNTTFTFRVKYTDSDGDAPGVGYPKLRVKNNGSDISGSPFAMTYVSGSYGTGAIYTHPLTLLSSTNYTYYFEAQDAIGAVASGSPTLPVSDLHVAVGWVFAGLSPASGQQTADGGYVSAGNGINGGGSLTKINSSGNISWDKAFGVYWFRSVRQTVDGGYIVAGSSYSSAADKTEGYLMKTDSSGNKLWEKIFNSGTVAQWLAKLLMADML